MSNQIEQNSSIQSPNSEQSRVEVETGLSVIKDHFIASADQVDRLQDFRSNTNNLIHQVLRPKKIEVDFLEMQKAFEDDYYQEIEKWSFKPSDKDDDFAILQLDPDTNCYYYVSDYDGSGETTPRRSERDLSYVRFELPSFKAIMDSITPKQVNLCKQMQRNGEEPKLQLVPLAKNDSTLINFLDEIREEIISKKEVEQEQSNFERLNSPAMKRLQSSLKELGLSDQDIAQRFLPGLLGTTDGQNKSERKKGSLNTKFYVLPNVPKWSELGQGSVVIDKTETIYEPEQIRPELFSYRRFGANISWCLLSPWGGMKKFEYIKKYNGWAVEIIATNSTPKAKKEGNIFEKAQHYLKEARAQGFSGCTLGSILSLQTEALGQGKFDVDHDFYTILPDSSAVGVFALRAWYSHGDDKNIHNIPAIHLAGVVNNVLELRKYAPEGLDDVRFRRLIRLNVHCSMHEI